MASEQSTTRIKRLTDLPTTFNTSETTMTETEDKGLYAGLSVIQTGLGALMVHQAGYMTSTGLAVIGTLVAAIGIGAVALIAYKDWHGETATAFKQE